MPVSRTASKKRKKPKRTAGRSLPNPTPPLGMIHKRIAQFASDNPDSTEYCLNTELEAAQLCLEIAASAEHIARNEHNNRAKSNAYRHEASILKGYVSSKSALLYFTAMDTPLEMFGLELTAERKTP